MAPTNIQPGHNKNAGGSNTNANANLAGQSSGRGGSGTGEGGVPAVEEGKWFQELDESYLLPLFSSAMTNLTFHTQMARRSQNPGLGSPFANSPMDSGDEDCRDEVGLSGGKWTPVLWGRGSASPAAGCCQGQASSSRASSDHLSLLLVSHLVSFIRALLTSNRY